MEKLSVIFLLRNWLPTVIVNEIKLWLQLGNFPNKIKVRNLNIYNFNYGYIILLCVLSKFSKHHNEYFVILTSPLWINKRFLLNREEYSWIIDWMTLKLIQLCVLCRETEPSLGLQCISWCSARYSLGLYRQGTLDLEIAAIRWRLWICIDIMVKTGQAYYRVCCSKSIATCTTICTHFLSSFSWHWNAGYLIYYSRF